jgi:hypothetical protein
VHQLCQHLGLWYWFLTISPTQDIDITTADVTTTTTQVDDTTGTDLTTNATQRVDATNVDLSTTTTHGVGSYFNTLDCDSG